ncbi:MAG: molybdopterin-dependent oxidoreductase [Desulfobacterales bacterium]|nr:molybdopterin-dependent oxidoreductase [Deltaproteobacteria bacterium]NNK96998.1 molybdopterin-dependent oxidoreductase [Desulfobacterales bacterium]
MNIKEQKLHQSGTLGIVKSMALSVNITLFVLILLCVTGAQIAQSQDQSPPTSATQSPCTLSPIVVPTLPDKIPGYTELDPETQLHVTGTAQVIDIHSYTLKITGKVPQPLNLKYDDLRCMPAIEARPTLVCPGFFVDTATWAGASLKHVLELADVQEGASHIRLVSADGYAALVTMEKALSDKNFLAYELAGEPIPVIHGFPIRAVFPDMQGNKWVKWLVGIEVQ